MRVDFVVIVGMRMYFPANLFLSRIGLNGATIL